MDPEPKTFKCIETNWHLLNRRAWPYPTAAGKPSDLRWKVKVSTRGGIRVGEMRVIDAPGHDIRPIFADDNVKALDGLPAVQRDLAEYCRAADVTVFVADLNDYIEKPDVLQHIEDETILKSAMDFLRKHNRRYCLVLTKADLYRDYIAKQGGMAVIEAKHLGSVYRSHLTAGVPCFPVACVNNTESIVDGESTRIVPTPGFDSTGLDPFIEWLVNGIGSVPPLEPAPPPETRPQNTADLWPAYVATGLSLVLFVNNCSKVETHWNRPNTSHFDPASIPISLVFFFVVWGVLAGLRGVVNFLRRRR